MHDPDDEVGSDKNEPGRSRKSEGVEGRGDEGAGNDANNGRRTHSTQPKRLSTHRSSRGDNKPSLGGLVAAPIIAPRWTEMCLQQKNSGSS